MRRLLAFTFCLFFVLAGTSHADVKIAVYDLQALVNKSDAFKHATQELNKTFDGKKKELEKRRQEIETLGKAMSSSSTTEQQNKLRELQKAYTEFANDYVKNAQAADQKARETMDLLIATAAKQYAKSKGLQLILDSTMATYVDPSMDITNDLLTIMNKVWAEDQKAK